MQSTALPPLLTDLPADDRARLLDDEALRHLPAVFAAVPDPRGRQGRRYPLPFLLTCLVAALLCDCNSTAAIGQWCIERRALLARHFPHQRAHTPTGALYRWLLPRLSVAELEWALASWVRQTRPTRDREPLALDGKVVRGALTITQPAPHLLSVSTHQTHETLIQIRVSDKTNEIPVAQALLPHLPLRGRVVTADALHTQSALAQVIRDQGGDYVLCVKGNQPRLYAELACYCDDPQATAVSATTLDRRRGRTETRTLHVTTRLNAYVLTSAACLGVLQGCPLLQEGSNLAWCYGTRHQGQSSDLGDRGKGPISLLETILRPVLPLQDTAARVWHHVGLHERSASHRTRSFLLDTNTLIGLFRAQRRLYFAPGVAFRNTRPSRGARRWRAASLRPRRRAGACCSPRASSCRGHAQTT